jgi:hypothetical protein
VAILLAPVLLILGLAFLGGADPASAKAPPAGKAPLAIAFVSSFDNSPSAASFQRIGLNVISVRLNPSTDPNVSEFDGRWVSIPVPAGVGTNTGQFEVSTGNNFGGTLSNSNSSVLIGTGKSEIQIELNAIQNIAEIFNAQNIPAKTYNQVELVLDPPNPGNVVPLCPGPFGAEGCISYQAKFPVVTPTPVTPMTIRTTATIDLSKSSLVVTPLVIKIDPGIGAPPTTPNQTVQVNPTISVVPNTTSTSPFNNPRLATLVGKINTTAHSGFSGTRTQAITAELAGTNNIVEKILLPKSCNGKMTCTFTMYLPALDASVGGTNYDLFASAVSTTYTVRSNVNLAAGQTTDITAAPMKVSTKPTNGLSGKVTDACTSGIGVQAATLNLLVADPLASPNDCTKNPPTGCVVAASGSSDEVGNFPLPGNGLLRAPFNLVPAPDTTSSYELVTTAAGFDRTLVNVTAKSGVLKCTPNLKKGTCDFGMNHGQLTGNVTLGGGGNGPISVLIMAEDSATNNIENLAFVTIPSGGTTAPFTMNVPDQTNVGINNVPVTDLDLFASAQDLFNGVPQRDTGHTIAVDSVVAAPLTACAAPVVAPDLGGITCVGHGSVSGTVTNPVGGDTVVLSLGGVQLESVPVVPPAHALAGNYSLCAPADPAAYTLDHLDSAGTVVGSTSVTLIAPVVVPTPVPSPGVTPTPCPAICPNAVPNQNTGCLVCSGTNKSF